ncbi:MULTISPECIES: phosphonate C-P lyase system protein PhnH [Cupriavidus]|nr:MULTISPECIES: phosphonate C-P lyase system protein PhnH [Cupriavidus]
MDKTMELRAPGGAGPGLVAGFDDPVGDAQQVFRAALDAMAHPGRVQAPALACGAPQGLGAAMAALLLTLADGDTPVWLPAQVPAAARDFLRFHCGCPLVDTPAAAAFVAVPAGFDAPALSACAQGDPAYPDRSATLLLEVASLQQGEALSLSGPGIAQRQALQVEGLPPGLRAQWRANHARFPLGVDLMLTSGARFCALPRTTRMED